MGASLASCGPPDTRVYYESLSGPRGSAGVRHTWTGHGGEEMDMSQPKIVLAKVIMPAALACGIIGLIAGFSGHDWKPGVTGWFTGGTLAAVLCLAVLADHYCGTRAQGRG